MTQVSFNPTPRIGDLAHTRRNSGDSLTTWQISPFDLPKLVTVTFSTCGGCLREGSFEFRFHYISDEPVVNKEVLSNGVQVDRGSRTGRIYRLFFPVKVGKEMGPQLEEMIRSISNTLAPEGEAVRGGQERARGFRDRAVGSILSTMPPDVMNRLGVRGAYDLDQGSILSRCADVRPADTEIESEP